MHVQELPCVLIVLQLAMGATQGFSPEQENFLDETVASLMQARSVPGLAVAAVRGGRTLLTKGYGHRDLERSLPVTSTTLFNVACDKGLAMVATGSTTKAFTSTLAAEAVGRGRMDWDAPLTKYLRNFRLQDDFRTAQASLRDALAHKTGIPSYWGVTSSAVNISRQDLVRRMQWFGTRRQFRTRFLYSNYGIVLAGAAVEEATGLPWERAIHDLIFSPLGMSGSRVASTLSEEDWRDRVATSYSHSNGTFLPHDEKALLPSIESIAPAGAVYSCADDIVKWLQFHLSEGKGPDGRQLVARGALRETYRPAFALGSSNPGLTRDVYPVDDLRWDYGLAWYIGTYRGFKKIYHTGSFSSYNCRIVFLPAQEVGVWACSSGPGDSQAVNLITLVLLDLALGEEPWLNASTVRSFPAPWVPPKPPSTTPLPTSPATRPPGFAQPSYAINSTELAGQYNHRAFGTFYVTRDLRYSFGTLLRGRLLPDPQAPDHFFQTLDPPLAYRHQNFPEYPHGFPVTFLRHENGTLWGVRLPYLEFSLPPIFVRDGAVEPVYVPPATASPRQGQPCTSAAPSCRNVGLVLITTAVALLAG